MSLNSISAVQVSSPYSTNYKNASTVKLDNNILSLERTPLQDTVSFTSRKNVEPNNENIVKEKKSGFLKKAAVATASAVLPGLGQAINGQWGKAAFYALGAPLLATAAFLLNPIAGIAVGSCLEIANIVSAYRNA